MEEGHGCWTSISRQQVEKVWVRAPSSGLDSKVLRRQRELSPQHTDPFCSACGQTADLPCQPAVAPEGLVVWELQEVAWVPAEPA